MPIHPGEILLEEFLKPLGVTQRELAEAIQVPYQRVNEIVNQRRGITPGTALRLAKFLGTSVEFWLNLQQRCDLYTALSARKSRISARSGRSGEVRVLPWLADRERRPRD